MMVGDVQTFLGGWESSEPVALVCKEMWKRGGFRNQGLLMLAMFKERGWLPTHVLSACFRQYNARLFELRRGGVDGVKYDIVAERRDGVWGFLFRGKY